MSVKLSHLGDAHRVLRSTADEVKLAEFPHLDGPVGLSSAANRLVEGVTASLAGGSTQPLRETENRVTAWTSAHRSVLQKHSDITKKYHNHLNSCKRRNNQITVKEKSAHFCFYRLKKKRWVHVWKCKMCLWKQIYWHERKKETTWWRWMIRFHCLAWPKIQTENLLCKVDPRPLSDTSCNITLLWSVLTKKSFKCIRLLHKNQTDLRKLSEISWLLRISWF